MQQELSPYVRVGSIESSFVAYSLQLALQLDRVVRQELVIGFGDGWERIGDWVGSGGVG